MTARKLLTTQQLLLFKLNLLLFLLIWNDRCNSLLEEKNRLDRNLRLNFIAEDERRNIFIIINAFIFSERFPLEYFSSIKYFLKNCRFLSLYKRKNPLNVIWVRYSIISFTDFLVKLQAECFKFSLCICMLQAVWNQWYSPIFNVSSGWGRGGDPKSPNF